VVWGVARPAGVIVENPGIAHSNISAPLPGMQYVGTNQRTYQRRSSAKSAATHQ